MKHAVEVPLLCLFAPDPFERSAFVHCYVVSLVTFNLILGIGHACMVGVALIIHIFRVYSHDVPADMSGLRIPADVITNFEFRIHGRLLPEAFLIAINEDGMVTIAQESM